MLPVLLLTILLLTLWYLVKGVHANHQRHCELIITQEYLQSSAFDARSYADIAAQNQDLVKIYNGMGQSLAALHIQLQVAQKLWQLNPTQAQQSLKEAYQLSGSLMYEVRHIVKSLSQLDEINLDNLKSKI
ncbi:integral membrane sensor signal transduction histidine kinase [Calothrix sp. NIES-4071]|nr:integral membrane sensor signal transduction histidine kinase [Calothrix sp. NIES-4071]BAZ63032.1 integral membrane sensor signal transduction histidine kinase [Calothrix sp. NIES-4105]